MDRARLWQRELEAGSEQDLIVMLCNDLDTQQTGELPLTLEVEGGEPVVLAREPFLMGRWGQQTHRLSVKLPKENGAYTLKATARADDGSSTLSRRWVTLGDKSAPPPSQG